MAAHRSQDYAEDVRRMMALPEGFTIIKQPISFYRPMNRVLGLAALVQVCATLPHNFIAFEYPEANAPWWHDIAEGLPSPVVKNGMITVWERSGMGIDLIPGRARAYLTEEDSAFFG